jgi:uncharacterized membrane protein YoaT (DUF817 family)
MYYVLSLADGFWYLTIRVTMNCLQNVDLRALISLSVTKVTNLIVISAYDYVIQFALHLLQLDNDANMHFA